MPDLVVRCIDSTLADALAARAERNGRSAEAEHHEILVRALMPLHRQSFAQVLASMPDVGTDADFERVRETAKSRGAEA